MESKLYELDLDLFAHITNELDLRAHFNLCLASRKILDYLSPGFLHRCGLKFLDDDAGTLDELIFNLVSPLTRSMLVVIGLSKCVTTVRRLVCQFFDRGRPVAHLPIPYQRTLQTLARKLPSEVSISGWRHHERTRLSFMHLQLNKTGPPPDLSSPSIMPCLSYFSSIRALELRYCGWHSNEWSTFGLELLLPSLKELHIYKAMRSPYMLLKFLRRHPAITLLHVHDFTVWEPFQAFRAPDFLPCLQSLHAPIIFIVMFFDEQFIGTKSHPSDLEITCHRSDCAFPDRWRDVSTWLGRLPCRLEDLTVKIKFILDSLWHDDLLPFPTPSVPIAGFILELRSRQWSGVGRESYVSLSKWLSHFGNFQWLEVQSRDRFLLPDRQPTLAGVAAGSELADMVFTQLPSVNTVKVDHNMYTRNREG